MKISFLLFSFFIINISFSQETVEEYELEEFISYLKSKKVETFFQFKKSNYNDVGIYNENDCYAFYEIYVFWENDGKNYLKKFNDCNYYKTFEISNSKVIQYFKRNKDKIKNEIVKEYTIKENDSISITMNVSHSAIDKLIFEDINRIFEKEFEPFNLTTDKKEKNIYYKYNNELSLIKLTKMCNKVIEKFEKN